MKKSTRNLLSGVCYFLAAVLLLIYCISHPSFLSFVVLAIDITLCIMRIKDYLLADEEDGGEGSQ